MLIAIEGPNGSGKNSVSQYLEQAVEESNAKHRSRPTVKMLVTHEPTDEYFGRAVKLIIATQDKRQEIDALIERDMRDRLGGFIGDLDVNHHYDEIADRAYAILRKLQLGERVCGLDLQFLYFIDRFYHMRDVIAPALKAGIWVLANRLVSSGPYGLAQGIPLRETLDLEAKVLERVRTEPDMIVYLDLSAPACVGRLKRNSEPVDIFETQYNIERVIQGYRDILTLAEEQGVAVLRIDASRPLEEISRSVLESIRKYFKFNYQNAPI